MLALPAYACHGWESLSDFLSSLGLHRSTSVEALRSMQRRHGLPMRGTGKCGSPVVFKPADIERWVRFLTGGVSLDLWCAQIAQDARNGVEATLTAAKPARATEAALSVALAPLYVVTSRLFGRGEGVHRLSSGLTLATTRPDVAEDWGVVDDLPYGCSFWRYDRSRLATRGDLAPRARPPRSRVATSLLVAVDLVGSKATFCRVSAGRFGGDPQGLTALVLSTNDPHRDAVVGLGRDEHPKATWFVWSRRREVRPVTLDEPPRRDAMTELMDDLDVDER